MSGKLHLGSTSKGPAGTTISNLSPLHGELPGLGWSALTGKPQSLPLLLVLTLAHGRS